MLGAMFGETSMRSDENVQHNLHYIFELCRPTIQSGNGNFDKELVRTSVWHPSQLLKLLPDIKESKFTIVSLDADILSMRNVVDRARQKRILRSAHIVFVTGASRSGKTTFSRSLVDLLKQRGMQASLLSQDDYRLPSNVFVFGKKSWEDRNATDWNRLESQLNLVQETNDFVIVEGYCLFYGPASFISRSNDIVYLDTTVEICKARGRKFPTKERYGHLGWDSMNEYIDDCVWEFHKEYESFFKQLNLKVTFQLSEDSNQRANIECVCESLVSSKR